MCTRSKRTRKVRVFVSGGIRRQLWRTLDNIWGGKAKEGILRKGGPLGLRYGCTCLKKSVGTGHDILAARAIVIYWTGKGGSGHVGGGWGKSRNSIEARPRNRALGKRVEDREKRKVRAGPAGERRRHGQVLGSWVVRDWGGVSVQQVQS